MTINDVMGLLYRANGLLERVEEAILLVTQYPHAIGTSHSHRKALEGLGKLKSLIRNEFKFLNRLAMNPATIKASHTKCSNLVYLEAVLSQIEQNPLEFHALQTFKFVKGNQNDVTETVRVDVVSQDGQKWYKVKASSSWEVEIADSEDSDSSEGFVGKQPAIIKQTQCLVEAARQNPVHFKAPQITVKFTDSMPPNALLANLRSIGAAVELRGHSQPRNTRKMEYAVPELTHSLNLDTTTLIALVTDICHLFDQIPFEVYDVEALQEQFRNEQNEQLLPVLQSVFDGHDLVTTRTAFTKFCDIVSLMGGPREKARAKAMFSPNMAQHPSNSHEQNESHEGRSMFKIRVIDDRISDRFTNLSLSAKSKHNAMIVGTGDFHQMTTVTANASLERSITEKGLRNVSLWIHQPRSLIERRFDRYQKKGGFEWGSGAD